MFNIRRAKLSDAPNLPEIEVSAGTAFRSVPELAWVADCEVVSAEVHKTYIEEGLTWVAEMQNQLVGFVMVRGFEDALHVMELSVAYNQQGHGVGQQLMETAKDHAIAEGFKALTLTTFRELRFNELFYHKLGFETLKENELSPRLQERLSAEKEEGLPRERRCAMLKVL